MRSLICLVIATFVLLSLSLHTSGQERLRGFGPKAGQPRLTGFGANAETRVHVIDAIDAALVKNWMSRFDRNRNGVLEWNEMVSWGGAGEVLKYDLNRDGRMPVPELMLALARLRMKEARALRDKVRQAEMAAAKQAAAKATPAAPSRPVDPLVVARRNMCNQLASELIKQHDRNGNKQLELSEWQASDARFGNYSGGADTNADDKITKAELAEWLTRRLPPLRSEQLAKPLRPLDVDRDGQVTMPEYANPLSKAKIAEFRIFDQNNDGLISPKESYAPPVPPGAIGFVSKSSKLINSNQEVTSSIWIEEDINIEDLDVRVAITKQNDGRLTFDSGFLPRMMLFLIGPDGQRVTLFAGGWQPWSVAHPFESTLFDDEAPLIEKTLTQPPLIRRLRTDALKTEEPGLRHFYTKSSRGLWRLVVINTNDKVGVLHRWSLWVTPK